MGEAGGALAARVRVWLFDGALPLWAEVGVDRETGGFVDWLEPDGAPARGADKRLRVQARQIYLFAHAAALGWTGPGLATAAAGYDFMTRHFWHPDGGWIFSVDQWGRPRDRTRAREATATPLRRGSRSAAPRRRTRGSSRRRPAAPEHRRSRKEMPRMERSACSSETD